MTRALLVMIVLAGCSDPAPRPVTFGGDRPVDLHIPDGFDDAKTYPLVVVLHGYSVNGFIQQAYLGAKQLADSGEAFLIWPDGLYDSKNRPYWNADPACCDFDGANPDDVGYLSDLIDDVVASWPIDRDAVFVVGHANGGYMAYRMACERADAIAGVVVIAGAAGMDPAACQPTQPVSVLHMHGTADVEFAYDGGGPFGMAPGSPGAIESATRWAGYDGCSTTRTPTGEPLDLDSVVAGAETTREQFACDAPTGVELWTMTGTEHLPGMTSTFVPIVWPWLLDHRR
ncbi:MAG TPA: hypothetical protein VFQ53_41360 [Kofleriaceae bacterium]|nr:hypothetical protein [Kofleriaceae bacterium]